MKILLFLVGLFSGGAVVGSYLVSDSAEAREQSASMPLPDAARARLAVVQARWTEARAAGAREGDRTRQRVQEQLDADRRKGATTGS